MKYLFYSLKLYLKLPLYWCCIAGIILAYIVITSSELLVFKPELSYLLVFGFGLDIANVSYFIIFGLTVAGLFCVDYHSNRLVFLLPRLGYVKYAASIVGIFALVIYSIGIFSFVGITLYNLIMTQLDFKDSMSDLIGGFLYRDHRLVEFLIVFFNNYILTVIFYGLLNLIITICYPNKSLAFLIPVTLWFMFTHLKLESILPVIFLPHLILSQNNNLVDLFHYFKLPYSDILSVILPAVYVILTACLCILIMSWLLKHQHHYYEKE